ncbi:MAG: DUF1638 domain-containing protein [Fimbriimonadaceae bacterium]|nr:DUF1638 domain-containing protein [Fimbriimonadaceae bacterium]
MEPRVVVIACAVLELEIEAFAVGLPHIVAIVKLEQGLHNEPDRLRRELQAEVDRVEAAYGPDVIVLGYGLCSRGVEGVQARKAKIVLTRAHDCITLLLGDRRRYAEYARLHPGTYWYSPGWNKHHVPPGEERHRLLRDRYVREYGEDNAEFLMEQEQNWFQTYDRATFVDLGVSETEDDEAYTKRCAAWLGWGYDRQRGDPGLLRDLLTGPWDDERFLVLEPGESARMTADERVVEATS